MPVDKKELKRYVEELGLTEALQANILQELEADEKRANSFVGQRLRQDDYSRKTMELAEQRKAMEKGVENAVGQAVQEYAQRLQQAEGKMSQILKDLETERISRTTAEERLQRVKRQYELSDDDIPVPAPSGAPQPKPDIDLDQRLTQFKKEFKESFIKELMPELMSFPQISAIQQDIIAEHAALTGKRLTAKDLAKLADLAPKAGGLYKAWEQEYEIANIRMQKHDEELTTRERQKWDDEQKRKASEAALSGVTHTAQDGKPFAPSPVLRTYRDRSKDAPPSDTNGKPNGSSGESPRLSGAERATVSWLERRNQGIPFGKDAPSK